MDFNISALAPQLQNGVIELKKDFSFSIGENGVLLAAQKGDCLEVNTSENTAKITYFEECEFYRGFLKLLSGADTVKERRVFKDLGLLADNSRNGVLNAESAKRLVRTLSVLGFNLLQLYTEDTYEIPGEPYFGYLRGRFTKDEIRELDAYCAVFGVTLMPCIQTLAHLRSAMRWPAYSDIIDNNDILLAGDERTYALIDNMFKSLSESFTCRRVNIGMDEAHMIGLGKYLDKHGYQNRFDILRGHLDRVLEIAARYGFTCSMWSDMFFKLAFEDYGGSAYPEGKTITPEAVECAPKNVELIYWDYFGSKREIYDNLIENHQRFKNKLWFAGGALKWFGFTPENAYSARISALALDSCIAHGVQNILCTAWGDNGAEASAFSILPTLAYYAERAYGAGAENAGTRTAATVKSVSGVSLEDFFTLALPNTLMPGRESKLISNSSKVFLYNDCLLGIFDYLVGDYQKTFTASLKKLAAAKARAGRYAYLFDTAHALLDVVAKKYDLGVRLRAAYKNGNKAELKKIAENDMAAALRKLKVFYEALRAQWMRDNKPHGFDVQDIRLGALAGRIAACRRTVLDYCSGLTRSIPELEETILADAEPFDPADHFVFNNWQLNVTVNPL